jgi:hypothetical protein
MGWLLSGYDPDLTHFPQPIGNSIYDALWEKYSRRCDGGPEPFPGGGNFTRGNVGSAVDAARNNRNCNVVIHTGDAELDNNSWTVHGYGHGGGGSTEEPGVIFIDGDFDIKRTLKIEDDNGLIFVVSGDIDVERDVSRVDGFFISDGEFYTDKDATLLPTEYILYINGSVISFGDDGIDWTRETPGHGRSGTSALNRSNAIEQLTYQAKYLWLFRNYQGGIQSVFTEVPP